MQHLHAQGLVCTSGHHKALSHVQQLSPSLIFPHVKTWAPRGVILKKEHKEAKMIHAVFGLKADSEPDQILKPTQD